MFDNQLMKDRLLMRCNFITDLIRKSGGKIEGKKLYEMAYKEGGILFRKKYEDFTQDEIFRDCLAHLSFLKRVELSPGSLNIILVEKDN